MKSLGSTPYPATWESTRSKKRSGDTLGMSGRSSKVKKLIREREKKAYRALLKTFTKWTDDDKEDVNSENVKGLPGLILADISSVSEIKHLDNSLLNNTSISLINDSNLAIKQPQESTPASSKNFASFRKVFARDLIITAKVQAPVVLDLEEKKAEPVKSEPEFKLPSLPKSYENFKLEKAEKKKLFSREWINEMRRAIQDGHLEAEKIRREKEDYLRIIGKKREIFMRKFRRETSKSFHEADFSYLPYFYRFFSDEIVEPEEEEDTEEDFDGEESEEEEEEEEEDEEEPSLPEEALQVIEDCFSKRKDELVVEENGVEVRVKDLETLKGTCWLNDEVINFYFQLIQKRSADNKETAENLKVYCFNTFFYKRLTEGGHKALKRWTKKVDLFSYDLILIPVHLSVHWTLAAISVRDSTIKYYDSMSGNNRECLSQLLKYLEDEMKDKKQQVLDTSKWECVIVKDIPQQENGSDCGVFTCKYAERLALDKPFNFSQRNIPFIRQKMIYEISQKELLMDKSQESKSLKDV